MARRVHLTRGAVRRSGTRHTELGNRTLEAITGPRGGIRGYRTVRGEPQTYSRRLIERIFLRSHAGERGSTRLHPRNPLRVGEQRHQQAVADYMQRNPDVSRGEAHARVYEAKQYVGRPLENQDIGQRTGALIDLGVIGPDETSRGMYPIDLGDQPAEPQELEEAG